jgi:FAD/FMN-containing dehydrogenase
VTANHRTNPDIFWAMRGGGGPSFGIATTLTYRTHPAPPLIASFFVASTNSTSSLTALFTEWHREMPRLADEGWSGFYPFNATLFALTLINQNASFAEANASIEPFFSKAAAIPGISISVSFNLPYSGELLTFNDD